MLDYLKKMLSGSAESDANKDKKILVVEDSDVDRKIIVTTLERQGYSVVTASNGVEGLAIMEKESPHMAILDCEMPNMGGVEMCKALKANPATKDLPVVFLTGVNTPTNILDCFEVDAENYLTKPINTKILINQVADIFARLESNQSID